MFFYDFSSKLFKEIKGYDENIFLYYEDYDICMRSKKYCKLFIRTDITVLHKKIKQKKYKFIFYTFKKYYLCNA